MTFSTNFFHRVTLAFLSGFLVLSSCVATKEPVRSESFVAEKQFPIAVLPFENLSGTAAPLKHIRKAMIGRLETLGVTILEEEVLERFMARQRVRYTGGIDRSTARAMREETGAEAVLIASLELYNDVYPPKIALTSRLVSTGNNPAILWMDGIGLSGDDSAGIFELGLIKDHQVLLEKAQGLLSGSLAGYLSGERDGMNLKGKKKKFQPKLFYRSPVIDTGGKYTVAVVPFFNESARKNAGEIMALHFVNWLTELENFSVIEPGLIRQELLKLRIIMDGGISLAQADLIFDKLDADLIFTGKVIDYQDPRGSGGTPKVDFSTVLIERKSREVVWASKSYNEGDDGVFFFDWGKVHTAHVMASAMVRVTLEMMVR